MAEYWYMATGAMHWMKLHEIHMQGQSFFINATSPNGQKFSQEIKGMLEPINLYRFVVPNDALPLVINTLGSKRSPAPNGLDKQQWALRKALNLQKIPEQDPTAKAKMPVSMDNLQIVPIGIKTDPVRIMNETGVKQEAI